MIDQITFSWGVGWSALFALDASKPFACDRFTRGIGFDERGNTDYPDEDTLLETLQRCKGRAVDGVVLVGVPQVLDIAIARNRSFLG